MKERPILFSGEMVRAILECRKTQTRRIVKIDSPTLEFDTCNPPWPTCADKYGDFFRVPCKYGKPGDRLWVREQLFNNDDTWCYSADSKMVGIKHTDWQIKNCSKGYVPPIHMPRWASRITLEIVNVRVERLQDISYEEASKEGATIFTGGVHNCQHTLDKYPCLRCSFQELWNKINGPSAWEKNPWVWVIEFRKL